MNLVPKDVGEKDNKTAKNFQRPSARLSAIKADALVQTHGNVVISFALVDVPDQSRVIVW